MFVRQFFRFSTNFSTIARPTVAVKPLEKQIMICNVSPVPGSHINKKRVGRGGRRGGSSGRGNGGQKHHGKRPAPWFTGLYTNPIIEALPRWNFAPRHLKPNYKRLNLDRIQHFVETGKLDASKIITMKELRESGAVNGKIQDGVKLLGHGSEYFSVQNLRIEVSKVSKSAITAIETHNGQVKTVYHTKKGLEQLLNSTNDDAIKYRFEPPVYEKDIEYYSNPANRGYLSNIDEFVRDFEPRGYVYPETGELPSVPHTVHVKYKIEGMNEVLEELKQRQNERCEIEAHQ